jgi:hypothetical protein
MAGRIAPLQRRPRRGNPLPGVGGYDYPRGPYGATGFPGSTPAAPPTHPQTPDGQRGARQTGGQQQAAVPQWTPSQNQSEWNRFYGPDGLPYNPRARIVSSKGTPQRAAVPNNQDTERRTSPAINHVPPGGQKLRNTVAQRIHAVPGPVRSYLSSPNPGKNGGQPARDRSAGFDQDAGVTLGGEPSTVMVSSRYVAHPDQDGYSVQRPIPLRVAAFPPGYSGDYHIRGGRLTGERYFGALDDQQRIGLPSDAYGIARRRGPNHRPVRFEVPPPWAQNFYDVSPSADAQPVDMVYRSPGRPRRSGKSPDQAGATRRTSRGKRRG